MTESIVSLVVETLGSLIRDEVILFINFHTELEHIKEQFQMIQACLKDAEAKGEIERGEQVKVWLRQLRHVAFDIEDLLEEYLFRYHEQHLHFCGYGTCGFIYRIKNFLYKYLFQRHKLARRIEDIKGRLDNISKGKDKYQFHDSLGASTSRPIRREARNPQDDALFLDDDKVVGIDENKSKLITRLITGETSLGVSCVFGQGGVGKTTLVKKVYENLEVKSHFKIRGWIVVSQNYDSNRLMKELILATLNEEEKKSVGSQLEGMDARNLKGKLHNSYKDRRYLIVIDDIWGIAAWREIKPALPDSGCGSRIIVTTRSERIANYCQENSGVVFKLEPLSEDDSLSLFQKMASKSDVLKSNCSIDQHTKGVIQNFLHKCGGLPLAIVAIAGLLSTKHTIVEWEKIYTDNGSLLNHPELDDVNIILSLSYHDLSYHLKSCLLYLCMFPEDHLIDCSSLLQLWAAEGFCESNTVDITKEDKAEDYLDELIARSLIQVQENHDDSGRLRPSKCRIHDLLRDFILKKARDQEFAECLRGDETNSGRLRRVSFLDAKAKNHNTLSSSLRQIRSLLMFGSDITASTVFTIICGGGIKLMKVLHLEARLAEFPGKDVTANLIFLRYLHLDLEKKLTSLPSYLGKLVYLETFYLTFNSYPRACVELPDEILKLTRLRNLICELGGFVLPKEIGRLSALENLYDVDGSRGIDGAELGKLTRLRSLKIVDLREEDASYLPSYLGKLVYLETLDLSLGEVRDVFSVELPDEILKLTRLRNLINFGGFVLPKEIGRLSALENLYKVNGSRGIDGAELGKLTRLRSLEISDLREEDATAVLASVEKMKHLRLLSIENYGNSNSISSFEAPPPPPPMLQYLAVYARIKGTPTDWICSLERLQSLDLSHCEIKEESFFEGLQLRLTNLVTLELRDDAIEVEEWCFLPRSFLKLRTLILSGFSKLKLIKVEEGAMPCIQTILFLECKKLKLIKVEEGAMPCIQTISLTICKKLKNVPTGIEHLTTLKEIELSSMSKHFEMAIRSHCWKPGHSPAIDAWDSIDDSDAEEEEENTKNSDEDIVHNQEGDQETMIHNDDDDDIGNKIESCDEDAEEENANNSDEDIVHNQETIIHDDDDDIVQI